MTIDPVQQTGDASRRQAKGVSVEMDSDTRRIRIFVKILMNAYWDITVTLTQSVLM